MLALIAGEGRLPVLLAEHLAAQGRAFQLCELEGFPAENPTGAEVIRFRVERLGSFLSTLKKRGVTEVCFAGRVQRPKLDPKKVDLATMPLVPRMLSAIKAGDDGALRQVIAIFEGAGLSVIGAHDILPDLLPPVGNLTSQRPDDRARKDATRGAAIVAAMGVADVGQSCVVAAGQALAIEALPGTDRMLAALAADRDGLPDGGIFFKAPKPSQDRRVDLPVIGPATIRAAAKARLTGVVIEAGGVMVLDRDDTVAAAEEAGLFLWVREAG
ncbi:MAG: UDP-2,3-diacylglucosamine diphosphatase LpxI [Rhodobacteraceae bacterium]|nr:UDP-2,3-diacylglucosamine diphosphatase LpxI [Paracoccaceae bacterium]